MHDVPVSAIHLGPVPCSSRPGFLKALQLVLQVVEGGLVTAGPPCGSFIVMNMGTSGRTESRPCGNRRSYVVQANKCLRQTEQTNSCKTYC